MYSSRVHRMVEDWTTCMRLLSWRRHQGTMLKNCILILPVSDPAKQAAQAVFTLNFLPYKPTGPVSSNIYRPTINSTGPNLKNTLMTIN
jgi:hypothetical protein